MSANHQVPRRPDPWDRKFIYDGEYDTAMWVVDSVGGAGEVGIPITYSELETLKSFLSHAFPEMFPYPAQHRKDDTYFDGAALCLDCPRNSLGNLVSWESAHG